MTDLDLLRAALPAYEFEDILGRGAWGVVIGAHHRRLNRPVAVKMLPLAATQDDNVRRRFATEARLLATLDHPHVVRIHDYIEQDEVCALIMERLTGGTLADRMRLGPLDPARASAIQLATLHGLEHAHQHGVLHRDIKPDNLMFAADGVLKITDFGIATVLGDKAEHLTATGISLGTPAYMAPEQLDDANTIGEATDVWAAAAVFYELLTGAVPYPSGSNLRATLLARATQDARPIDAVDPDVPRELGRAIMRALDRNPGARFGSSGEFADAIDQAGRKLWGQEWIEETATPVYRTSPRTSGATATSTVASIRGAGSTGARRRAQPKRRNLVIAAASTVVIAAAATIGIVAFGGDDDGNPAGGSGPSTYWASWISTEKQISTSPTQRSLVAPVPTGWGNRLAVGINLDPVRQLAIGAHFGDGVVAETGFAGDPINGPSWNKDKGAHPARDQILNLEKSGSAPYVTYYILRTIGRGATNDASEEDVAKQLRDATKMKAYWQDVTAFLKQLGSLDQPIPINVEPGVSSTMEVLYAGDATKVKALVASSGNKDLKGLPNTFSGWARAWVHLRDLYAPKLMLGLGLDPWAAGDYLVPFNPIYKDKDIPKWAKLFADYYRTLGAKFDFINYVSAFGEAGKLTSKDADYYPKDADFARLINWTYNLAKGTHLRVVIESVPMGNSIMAPVNNKPFHWKDEYVEWLLGESTYAHLNDLRDAGAIGVVFGFGYANADTTCPCDAAGDAMTQGVPDGVPIKGRQSVSSDDDGGYLKDRVSAYLTAGGMPLN